MTTQRWNDDRLDDLRDLVESNGKTVEHHGLTLAAHDLQLIEVARRENARDDRRFSMLLMVATILLGQGATIASVLLTAH